MRYALIGVLAALALLAVVVLDRDDEPSARRTYAELVAHNYRVLTTSQSRELVRYAGAVQRCVVSHGGKLAEPAASRTRITMRARGQSAGALVELLMACNPAVGPPPPKASLQARKGQVILFLPKQCLLAPSELS